MQVQLKPHFIDGLTELGLSFLVNWPQTLKCLQDMEQIQDWLLISFTVDNADSAYICLDILVS